MRLRHIPGSEEFIRDCEECIDEPEKLKGRWNEIFHNNKPLRLEIGMGKGQFIHRLALSDRDHNYIGIEVYPTVLMKAVMLRRKLIETGKTYDNLRYICMDAIGLADAFAKGEVEKIYLNFSDPWPKARHAQRRLTSERFLHIYEQILMDGGTIEFKTDNRALFDYSLESIPAAGWKISYVTRDLHSEVDSSENIMTEYEEKYSAKGQKIQKLIAGKE